LKQKPKSSSRRTETQEVQNKTRMQMKSYITHLSLKLKQRKKESLKNLGEEELKI